MHFVEFQHLPKAYAFCTSMGAGSWAGVEIQTFFFCETYTKTASNNLSFKKEREEEEGFWRENEKGLFPSEDIGVQTMI